MITQKAPATEFSEEFVRRLGELPGRLSGEFIEGMRQRMTVSYFKYGPVADAYPHKVNAIESCQMRIEKYILSGNTEFLMDAGNFLMIETMFPKRDNTFYGSCEIMATSPLQGIQDCIAAYSSTGNLSYIVSAGKFAMEEFMSPRHSQAFFKPTDASESPGRATSSLSVSHRSNDEI